MFRHLKDKKHKESRRQLFKIGSLMAGTTAVASALSLIPVNLTVYAKSTSSYDNDFISLQGNEAKKYVEQALASPELHLFQSTTLQKNKNVFEFQKDTESVFKSSKLQRIAVRVPIKSNAKNSCYIILFDSQTNRVTDTFSILLVQDVDKNTTMGFRWSDKAKFDSTTTPSGDILEGTIQRVDGTKINLGGKTVKSLYSSTGNVLPFLTHNSTCCVDNCLYDNYAFAELEAIAIACGIICVETDLIGCIPCAVVAGVFSGSEIGYCRAKCDEGYVYDGCTSL